MKHTIECTQCDKFYEGCPGIPDNSDKCIHKQNKEKQRIKH